MTINITNITEHPDGSFSCKAKVKYSSYWGYGKTKEEAIDDLKEYILVDIDEELIVHVAQNATIAP